MHKIALKKSPLNGGFLAGKCQRKRSFFNAFSLVELLVAMAIIAVLMAFLVPAMFSIQKAGDVTKAANGISGILEQARAYAMGNNTYVYVGFQEVDSTVSASVAPQKDSTSSPAAYGRVAVAVVASKDGTRGYNLSPSLVSPAWTNYNNGSNLIALNKLQYFDNLHIADLGTSPTSGGMTRTSIGGANYSLGNAGCQSVTPFAWPLGASLPATPSTPPVSPTQYVFYKVIQFDPQGVARIQFSANEDDIVISMEIGLQQTHGNAVSPLTTPVTTGAVAALQVDGMTGAVRIYRP